MSKMKTHINDYAIKLLNDKQFRNDEYQKFYDNTYIISDVDGNISSNVLHAVIRKAYVNRKVRSFLTDILHYVDEYSMTDENFRLLVRFPGRYKITYLSNVCHADLPFYQMQIINRFPVTFEAFAYLFDRICEHDFFKEEDMRQILRDARDITPYGVQACIDNARKLYGESDKLNVAVSWVNSR